MFLVSALAAANLVAQAPTTTSASMVPGTWTITSINGRPMPPQPPTTLTITGTTYQQARGGVTNERGTIRLDTSKTPMAVDFFITDGPAAGTTQLGVIEVSGNAMRISLGNPGAELRPVDFTTSDRVIVLLLSKTTP